MKAYFRSSRYNVKMFIAFLFVNLAASPSSRKNRK